MGFNYNHVTLVGRLTKDPDLKMYVQSKKLQFSIAINRPYKKSNGSVDTDFISIVFWGRLAEMGHKFLKKGSPVLIQGRIHVNTYEKEEKKQWHAEVVADHFQLLTSFSQKLQDEMAKNPLVYGALDDLNTDVLEEAEKNAKLSNILIDK